jgi:hypothetical protein
VKHVRNLSSQQPHPRFHQEALFRKLQLLAEERQTLNHRLHDWEASYQALREVENSLIQAYGSLPED